MSFPGGFSSMGKPKPLPVHTQAAASNDPKA